MGSVALTEVYHAREMLRQTGHISSSHENRPSHRSAASRASYADAPDKGSRSVASYVDTTMADAAARSFSAGSAAHSSPHRLQPAIGGSTAAQELTRSPRLNGAESYQQSTATFHNTQHPIPQTRVLPSSTSSSAHSSPARSANHLSTPSPNSPARIRVRSLSHIQSFVSDEHNPLSQSGSGSWRRDGVDSTPQYEISEMPVSDIIEMVAGLLTKITTTNDRQHEHLHRQIPPQDGASNLSQQTTSVLAFHGKNIPSISILSYLSRIHKYCPTTYEVFLSLLVYFDRMTERVNSGPLQSLRQANRQSLHRQAASEGSRHSSVSSAMWTCQSPPVVTEEQVTTPPPSGSLGAERLRPSPANPADTPPSPAIAIESSSDPDPYDLSHFFVVDSFNIHRLIIAGVTCASKFFSDIFYTNSRYAKVGGLPLPELNHLELQFLLLNDFRLAIPLEEMEAYGTMLVEFYAREVVAQQNASTSGLPAA